MQRRAIRSAGGESPELLRALDQLESVSCIFFLVIFFCTLNVFFYCHATDWLSSLQL
jgi:hypothetical protein